MKCCYAISARCVNRQLFANMLAVSICFVASKQPTHMLICFIYVKFTYDTFVTQLLIQNEFMIM